MPQPAMTLGVMRQFAASRSLPHPKSMQPTVLQAVQHLGFVQADPMRVPARAQDLILRHRVQGYQDGDLDRQFAELPLEEDFLINYGYLPRELALLMHPRQPKNVWTAAQTAHAKRVLAHIRTAGPSHPRDLVATFGAATTRNAWGGSSNATTHLLDGMQYRSMLRVARREAGIRVYEAMSTVENALSPDQRVQALMQALLRQYGPVTERGLRLLARYLHGGVPQFHSQIRSTLATMLRNLPQARIDGVTWLWPEAESPTDFERMSGVRLLAPFDPVVWDRERFELLHGWAYRFEAYTPASKRKLGHYALPLLVGDEVAGWANLKVQSERLHAEIGFVKSMATCPALKDQTLAELAKFAAFKGLKNTDCVVARHVNSVW